MGSRSLAVLPAIAGARAARHPAAAAVRYAGIAWIVLRPFLRLPTPFFGTPVTTAAAISLGIRSFPRLVAAVSAVGGGAVAVGLALLRQLVHERLLARLDVDLVQTVGPLEGRVRDGVPVQLVEGVELVQLGGPVGHRGGHVVGQLPARVGAVAARLVPVTAGKTGQGEVGPRVCQTSSGKTGQGEVGPRVCQTSSGKTGQGEVGPRVCQTSSGKTGQGEVGPRVCQTSSGKTGQGEVDLRVCQTSSGKTGQGEVGPRVCQTLSGKTRESEVGSRVCKTSSGKSRQSEVGSRVCQTVLPVSCK